MNKPRQTFFFNPNLLQTAEISKIETSEFVQPISFLKSCGTPKIIDFQWQK